MIYKQNNKYYFGISPNEHNVKENEKKFLIRQLLEEPCV
jgi:hypothetical protein